MLRRGLGLVLVLLGLSSVTSAQEALRIVATTTQAADLSRIIVGERLNAGVEVIGLMGAGVDPHLYKPTEANIEAMSQAQMIVYSGLHLEGQFDEVFEALSERGVRIVKLAEPIEREGYAMTSLDAEAGSEARPDPHFWFDPRNWQLSASYLAEQLGLADPDHADTYRQNAERYTAQLDLLYAWALEGMMSVPEAQRTLVTSHDAFQYFGVAFGWQMVAVQGISTADEAGVGDIEAIVNFVIENNIPVMFVESSVPPSTIQAVQEAIQAQGASVALGIRELYSDAMGASESYGGTYIGMIAENVLTILQSYQAQGVALSIPPYPAELEPALPAELLAGAG